MSLHYKRPSLLISPPYTLVRKEGRSSTVPSTLSILSIYCPALAVAMSTSAAIVKEQQLADLFSDFGVDFLSGQPLTLSDVRGPADFDVGILIELKGLGLFSLFKEFKEFLQMGVYKELVGLSCLADIRDLRNATTLFATHRA